MSPPARTFLASLAARCDSFEARHAATVQAALQARPLAPALRLEEGDLVHLPPPVQWYIRRSGAMGRPKVQNFRLEFDAQLWARPGAAPMTCLSVQQNFIAQPARFFFLQTRMFGLPVQVLHAYADGQASFQVRAARLVSLVDQAGERLSRAETVTVLNDLAIFAPGALIDRRLEWAPAGDRTAAVAFSNGRHRVTATLTFNERDELVNFVSDDRPAFVDGQYRPYRWSTPLEGHRDLDGLHLPAVGSTIYAYPEGDFTYGRFVLRSIAYDVTAPVGVSRGAPLPATAL